MNIAASPLSTNGWKRFVLGDVLTLINGRAYKQDELLENGTPVIRIQNLNGGNNWYYSDLKLPEEKYCQSGDLLFAWSASFGPYLWEGPRAIYHYHIWKVLPSALLDKRYAFYLLQSITEKVKASGRGISMIHVTKSGMEAWEVVLPPLGEQRRIAAILDKADALRRKRKRTIELLDSLTQSIFRRSFVERHSSKWPVHSVESVALDTRTGPFGSQLLRSEFVDQGISVLGIDNVVTNEFRWGERRYISEEKYAQLHRYTVSPGDVLITIMGTCGRCAIVPDDIPIAINTKHLCCITLDKEKCLPEFLQATFLQHPDVLQQLGVQAKGAVMPGLNMRIIKSLTISLPPIDLQMTFVKEILSLKAMLMSSRIAETTTASLFSSLQSRGFSNQL